MAKKLSLILVVLIILGGVFSFLIFRSSNEIKASELYNQKKNQHILNINEQNDNNLIRLDIEKINKEYIELKKDNEKIDFEFLKSNSDVIIEGKVLETINVIKTGKQNESSTEVYIKINKVLKNNGKLKKGTIIRVVEKGGLYTENEEPSYDQKDYKYMTNAGVMTSKVQDEGIYFLESKLSGDNFTVVGEFEGKFLKNKSGKFGLEMYNRLFKDYDIYEKENAIAINGIDIEYEKKINKEVSKYYNDN